MLESKLYELLEKFATKKYSFLDSRNNEDETYFEFESKSQRKEFKQILRNHGITKTQYVRDSYYDENLGKKIWIYRVCIIDIPFHLSDNVWARFANEDEAELNEDLEGYWSRKERGEI